MNIDAVTIEASVQRTHWWFEGRRRLLGRLLTDLAPKPAWRVLDVGAGTGANLPVLESLGVGSVIGCDLSVDALRHARRASRTVPVRADACQLPFTSGSIDLLIATDVIEHLDDDRGALQEFARVLRPGGHFVVTVPAFRSLWGPQDIVAHHRRRYRRETLLPLFQPAGLRVAKCFYFNYLLFAPIWVARKLLLALRVPVSSENAINGRLLNAVLTRVFFLDVDTATRVNAPFGVSLCVLGLRAGEPHT